MKKFVVLFLLLFFTSVNYSWAKAEKVSLPMIKFNGTQYRLYFSTKSKDLGGYINEYYKRNQGYATWDELIGLHHYPDAFYPIEHAKDFKIYLDESGISNNLVTDDKKNAATLDFVVINDRKLPIIMEFNIFRYQKSPVCGSTGFQYARRYYVTNALEVNKFKKDFAKNRKKYLKKFEKLKIPDLVTKEVDKGICLNAEPKEEKTVVQKPENKASENTEQDKKDITNNKEETAANPAGTENSAEEKAVAIPAGAENEKSAKEETATAAAGTESSAKEKKEELDDKSSEASVEKIEKDSVEKVAE